MKRRFIGKSAIPLLVILLATNASCSLSKDRKIAEQAVVQFHDEFNSGKYQDIYDKTDDTLRKFTNRSDLAKKFGFFHERLGIVKSSTCVAWSVFATTMGTTARFQYDTEFSGGMARETFSFLVTGGHARLESYLLSSPLLDTK